MHPYFQLVFFSLLLRIPLALGDCVDLGLGMEDGEIPSDRVTASSEQSANTPAKNGRLKYTPGSSWCAGTGDTNPYLQIDLQTIHIICAVSTQGNSKADQWVKDYKLQLSTDGTCWRDYKEGGQVKVLRGNNDRDTTVKHVIYGVSTRYLRFLPQTQQGGVCMRTEVFGVRQERVCEMKAIGLATGGAIPDSSFTASSYYDNRYKASYGRLNENNRGWAPKTTANPADFLQIDLLHNYVICSVATQGANGIKEWTTKYKIQLSLDGITFFTYKENNIAKVFTGNSNQNGIIKNNLQEFASAKFIRFWPTAFSVWKALRVEVYGIIPTKDCTTEAIGLARSGIIPDFSFTASSYYDNRYKPSYGRLNGNNRGWAPKNTTNPADFLQIDLLHKYAICAVATQGANGINEWTTDYKIQLSLDGTTFFTYKENSSVKVFPGNVDQNNITKNSLKEFSSAKFIRFQPTAYNSWKALRVEVYGIVPTKACKMEAIGLASGGAIPDSSFTALSYYDNRYKAYYGRLNGKNRGWAPKTTTNPADFLQVDLLYEYVICAVATQGANGINEWTINYKIHLSLDGITFFSYKENNIDKVFPGNSNQRDIIKNNLQEFASAKFIRFQPTAYYSWKALMVEVYGILLTKVPSQPPADFNLTASSSTSIIASWQLPPVLARHGRNITGFKLFYKEKSSAGLETTLLINSESTLSQNVVGLDKNTEYEFQILAFTSDGDGPKTPVKVERTKEDAPSAPLSFTYKEVAPNKMHGPRLNLTWSKPAEANGIIRSYTLFYANKDGETKQSVGGDAFSYLVDVLGGVTYHFYITAVTIKPGQNATFSVKTKEYEPSRGPENVLSIEIERTEYQLSWNGLPREVANGFIKIYQVRLLLKESCFSVDASFNSTFNTTKTEMLLSSLSICSRYEVSVRAFTAAGPGPYSEPLVIQTLGEVWSREKPSPAKFSSDGGITAKITLPNFMGHASFFQIIVITYRSDYNGVVNPPADFTTQELMTYEEAHKSPLPAAYVTFQFGGNDFNNHQEFTVGDGVQSNGKIRSKRSNGEEYYYNRPLHPNTNYRVFLRAFVTETLYTSSSFIALKTKDKPVVKELPEKTTIIVGEKAELTCEASGDPQPSVTWSKDGDTSIPRANFNNDGKVLVIRDVIPRDSGVYECTASNSFGVSHSATTLIVTGKRSNFPVAVIVVLCVFCVFLAVIGVLVYKWKYRRAGIELNDKTNDLNRLIYDVMGPLESSYEQLASSPGPCLQLHSMSSEGQSPAYLELQGLKFENRAFDRQSVSFEKETEEREGEDREEIVNDTGNSVC